MLFLVIVALVVSAYAEEATVAVPSAWWMPIPCLAGAVALVWAATWLLARRSARAQASADDPSRRALVHHRLLWGLRGLILGLYLWLVFAAGWPALVKRALGPGDWVVIDNWLVFSPYVAMLVVHWMALWPVDLLLRRRQASLAAIEPRSGVPLEPFRPWTRGQYLGLHLRHHILLVLVPVSLWWAGLDGLTWLLGALAVRSTTCHYVAALAWVLGVYLISPLLMRVIWSTRRLPESALRQRLEALCRRVGFRYRGILIWRTRCDIVNAAVSGLWGRLRYVFLTDGLLRHMSAEEIEAVFAHEAGHVRHRHLPLYLVFAGGSLVFALVLHTLLVEVHAALGWSDEALRILTEGWPFLLLTLGLYWGVLFGYLSRRFERQADVFAIRAVSAERERVSGAFFWDGSKGIARKKYLTPFPIPLDPVAVGQFARALDAVARLNGMTRNVPGWSHFSIARRIWFLEQALLDPRVEWRFQRSLRHLKLGWLAAALLGVGFLLWRL